VTKGIPAKVMWYLPIIPRLERLYANPKDAKLLRWHADERKKDGKLRHPADGIQWRNIDRKYPEFGREPRNIRFGLSTDGMNPFGNMSSRHSTWPVNLCIYNLPPWLCMKRKYLMMACLVQGPKQPGNDIDVYLQPLMDDIKKLWTHGEEVFDAHKRENFNMRCLLFCTINDYPALANLSGQSTKGKKACTNCLDDTSSVWLKHSGKTVYMRHRRFLRRDHPFRRMKKQFDGGIEAGTPPRKYCGKDVHDMVKDIQMTYGKGTKVKATREKPLWKKRSIFWDLPYWEDLEVRHCIDVMHVEKNVCDSVLGMLLNIKGKTKDGLNTRLDLLDMGIRKELHPKETDTGRMFCEPACYTLSRAEKREVCQFLHGVKVPSGYSSNIARLVSMEDFKLIGMKSHDCHVMITELLAIALRNVLPIKVREAITRLCSFFNTISRKVMDPVELDGIQDEVQKTLCQLEMYFPPTFFDIMVHLTVHLVREIKWCGPVFLRSMYPFERYMGILKHFVRNRSSPEGSIVEGYATEEVVEFCIDYMAAVKPIGVPESRHTGRLQGNGILGKKRIVHAWEILDQAHFLVLQHSCLVETYIIRHKAQLRMDNPKATDVWVIREHNRRFTTWLKQQPHGLSLGDPTLTYLAEGPSCTVTTWQGMDINGYTFYTRDQDRKSTNQNSGVRIDAQDTAGRKSSYYGYVEEIWELDYVEFKIPLFRCRWVTLSQVKVDKYGFTTVDLSTTAYKDDPFVLANQVAQIFYVTDPANKRRHVVRDSKRSIVGVDDVVDEDGYNQFDQVPSLHDDKTVEEEPNQDEATYIRDDHHEGITFVPK
jgi:hypothetical protein